MAKKYNWDEIILSFQQSGLSQAEFCRQNQLNATYLSLQLSKRNLTFRQARKTKKESPFVKVVERSETSSSGQITIEFHSTKIHIRQPETTWLADFCKALMS